MDRHAERAHKRPSFHLGLAVVRYAPDGIARVVGDEEGARVVHCDANRAPVRRAAAIILEKARQHIDGGPIGRPSLNGTKMTL